MELNQREIKKATEKQVTYIMALLEKKSYSEFEAVILLSGREVDPYVVDFDHLERLTTKQASMLIDELRKAPTKEMVAREEARRAENFRKHDELLAKAEALGLSVRRNMTSATLREMIAEVA